MNKSLKWAWTCVGLLAVMMILAACGATSATQVPAANSEESATRTITHLKGDSKIPMKPQRVVALSAAYIDHLLTIGEKPVGVNNEERYGADYLPYLADQLQGVATVGSAEAPNLEAIVQLNPDVILIESRTAESMYDQLSKIAPTIVLGNEWEEYDENPDFWTEDLLKIAEMYDKTELAQTKIDELKKETEAVKTLVEKSEHRKLAYIRVRQKLFQIYPQNGHPTNALLYHDLGFEPSSITPKEQREDLSLEGVADLDANQLILEVDPNGADFLQAAEQSSLWSKVPAVQQKQVYQTDSFWLFKGWGVIGRTQILEDVRKLVE
ncbi:iron-siderophore ABC transporter substrate-binding protein [Saccharibacillus sp. JS10]|uniref:ABC transporter substrate-binding protein n=1 Tax=Saccharibacillus sp. JS10 TaxID=2950552 RepID=UPI00210F030F|nr:iron-siderophore ABC transporter substrate-binding protein [Saccharibacillus sp. JS10]MCQ4086336.1 iron-siderophore ABC transporter substrate-binding protein [Saccharibacillus sp. JS10]